MTNKELKAYKLANMKIYREAQSVTLKRLWQYAFIGKVDIKKLYKCYGINPET